MNAAIEGGAIFPETQSSTTWITKTKKVYVSGKIPIPAKRLLGFIDKQHQGGAPSICRKDIRWSKPAPLSPSNIDRETTRLCEAGMMEVVHIHTGPKSYNIRYRITKLGLLQIL